jgi:hypothetical protein
MRSPNIELHIEELVLHGFAPGDRHAIGDAVECEIRRLFTEQGASPQLAQGGEVAHVDGGAFEVARGARAEKIGTQIGQALYDGLS